MLFPACRYGLIIPTKKNARPAFGLVSKPAEAKPKVFQDSSSSDDDLEKSDEDEGKVAMDWRARTVAVRDILNTFTF